MYQTQNENSFIKLHSPLKSIHSGFCPRPLQKNPPNIEMANVDNKRKSKNNFFHNRFGVFITMENKKLFDSLLYFQIAGKLLQKKIWQKANLLFPPFDFVTFRFSGKVMWFGLVIVLTTLSLLVCNIFFKVFQGFQTSSLKFLKRCK